MSRNTVLRAAALSALALGASQAHAACTPPGSSSEPSLQDVLNSLLSPHPISGVDAPNAVTDCLTDGTDASFHTVGSTGTVSISLELAGNARSNEFGIYDLRNPSLLLPIFEGADGAGTTATVQVTLLASGPNAGQYRVRAREQGENVPWSQVPFLLLPTNAFGFYMRSTTQGVTFYSDTRHNTVDHADHMYAYSGNGSVFATGEFMDELFTINDTILAWDDLLAPGGDRDFQDMVLVLKDITPVPLPTAVWLLASGLVGLAGVARRRG